MKSPYCTLGVAVAGLFFALVWAGGVRSEPQGPDAGAASHAALLDDLIQKYEAKMALGSSRSEALREDAREAGLKAAYCVKNRSVLLEAMTAEDLPVKSYQVRHYVNGCFIKAVFKNGDTALTAPGD